MVVVNETFARETFGGEPAVGQRLRFGGVGGEQETWEVIGVVADVRYGGLAVTESSAEMFISTYQMDSTRSFFFSSPYVAVRTNGDPLAVIPFLAEAVTEAHPRATLDDAMTMEARLAAAIAQPRFYAGFVGFFAALALFLAAFGVYALLSYTVAQRGREIGVRMALGAQSGDIVGLVVRQGAALVAAGAVAGLLGAAASSRVLESFLYGGNDGRPPDLRGGPARAGRRGDLRLLAAGPPRDPYRSDGCPARGIAPEFPGRMRVSRRRGASRTRPAHRRQARCA